MIETIKFNGKLYPKLQSEGFAAKFAFPFAETMLKGNGYDIGYSKPEWKFPGAIGIDEGKIMNGDIECHRDVSAMDLPGGDMDYIFSSHCLEHLHDWVGVLDYWKTKLKPKGVVFLYLPHCDYQEYWQPMNNRKHVNWLTPIMIQSYFNNGGWRNVFVTGDDLNASFYAIAEKI